MYFYQLHPHIYILFTFYQHPRESASSVQKSMANRDFAAPLKQERRRSIWAKLTQSLHLSTDWDSVHPLMEGLKEDFSESLRNEESVQGSSRALITEDASQPEHHPTALNFSRHPQTDFPRESSSGVCQQDNFGRLGCHHQQSIPRTLSGRSLQQEPSHQRVHYQSTIRYREPLAQLPPVRTHTPLSSADLYEVPRPAPLPPSLAIGTSARQQRNANGIIYHRNSNGQLVTVSQATHPSSRVNSIRRRPVQSSLRDQINQNGGSRLNVPSIQSHVVNGKVTNTSHPRSCNHSRVYSPLSTAEPNVVPPLRSPSSSAAHYMHSRNQEPHHAPGRAINVPPNFSTPTLADLQADITSASHPTELEGSLHYDPPSFPDIPLLPQPPFARRPSATRKGSTTSLATFENPDSSSLPLSFIRANMIGIKRQIQSGLGKPRSWKAKAVHFGEKIKYKSKWLWDPEDERYDLWNTKLEVWFFGPLPDCKCAICVRKKREDPETVTMLAHKILV